LSKNTNADVVEHLSRKHEVLSSNPSTAQKKEEEEEEVEGS
jgi:hypothetical protein